MASSEDFKNMRSACKNQQGNGYEAEKKCPNIFVIFVALCFIYAIIISLHAQFANSLGGY